MSRKIILLFIITVICFTSCNSVTGYDKHTFDSTVKTNAVTVNTADLKEPTIVTEYKEQLLYADDGTVVVKANVNYPKVYYPDGFEILADNFNKACETYADSILSSCKDYYDIALGSYDLSKNDGRQFIPFSYNVKFETTYFKNRIISVILTLEEYVGSSHFNYSITPIIFDLSCDESLSATTFLNSDILSITNYIRELFIKSIKNDPSMYFSGAENSLYDAINIKNYYLSEEGITFFVPTYSIAPYSSGIPKVTASREEIKNIFGIEY